MTDLAPDSPETERLLDRAQAGDERAVEELLSRHRAGLRRFVAFRLDPKLRSRLDPSDVIQETQLEVYQRLNDFLARRPMPFRVWLRKTAYERLLMLRRRHVEAAQRTVAREAPMPDSSSLLLAERFAPREASAGRQLVRRELALRTHRVLEKLSDVDREILFMRNFEELPYEEIAQILDIDAAAARKRHGRALLRLNKLLAEDGLTESQL